MRTYRLAAIETPGVREREGDGLRYTRKPTYDAGHIRQPLRVEPFIDEPMTKLVVNDFQVPGGLIVCPYIRRPKAIWMYRRDFYRNLNMLWQTLHSRVDCINHHMRALDHLAR